MRITRLAFVVAAIGTAVLALASNLSLITDEAMDTYRQAVKESANRPKSSAMLKGLLVQGLSVGIDTTTLPNNSPDFEQGVSDAIELWNSSLGEDVFKMVPTSVTADIVVRFVPKVNNGDHAQGYVQAKRHFFWKGKDSSAKVTGTVSIRDNVGRRYLRDHEVSNVMAHELGHLLGLNDSRGSRGVMGDFISGRASQAPTLEELESVIEFRGLVRAALDRPR